MPNNVLDTLEWNLGFSVSKQMRHVLGPYCRPFGLVGFLAGSSSLVLFARGSGAGAGRVKDSIRPADGSEEAYGVR